MVQVVVKGGTNAGRRRPLKEPYGARWICKHDVKHESYVRKAICGCKRPKE